MKNPTKEELRAWSKEVRNGFTDEKLDFISNEIIKKIHDLSCYKNAKNILSYYSKKIEVSLNGLFYDSNKKWFLPKVVPNNNLLIAPFEIEKTRLVSNKFGVFESDVENDLCFNQTTKKINLDLIFVPGLCFDESGYRIGFGKGYYDNFLKLNPNVIKIGCCPKELLIKKIPIDTWDEKVDLVITE